MKQLSYYLFLSLILLTSCSNSTQANDPIPKHESFKIKSKEVAEERTINVWLPENYTTSTATYDVMYMLDGGIKEDLPHLANTVEKLIKEGKIKPIIVVGIENTVRRRDLTGFTEVEKDKEVIPNFGGSAKFSAFIKNELFKAIETKYRVTNKRSIIGESAAGLFILETLFLSPDMFDNYIAIDPALWWNNHYLVRTAKAHLSQLPATEKRVWFAGSKAKDISPYTNRLANVLKNENFANLKWHYSDEPKEKHTTIYRATKEKAILWTLNKSE